MCSLVWTASRHTTTNTTRRRLLCRELALVHMLNLSEQYGPQFSKFMTMMALGLSVTNAFWQAYAKTLAQVQKDLDQYLRGSTFNAVLFDIKLQKSDEEPDVEPAPPLESSMVLADLLALTNK